MSARSALRTLPLDNQLIQKLWWNSVLVVHFKFWSERFGAMASGDQDTAVFDIAYECLSEFDKVYDSHGGDLTTRLFEMDDLSGGCSSESNCHIVRKCDFMGLRNSFIFWADYTGALSLMESSLDARLKGFPDISSMFVELLEMISRNLSRRK
jgi:hypothetical protein